MLRMRQDVTDPSWVIATHTEARELGELLLLWESVSGKIKYLKNSYMFYTVILTNRYTDFLETTQIYNISHLSGYHIF